MGLHRIKGPFPSRSPATGGDQSTSLAWDASSGATGYKVYVGSKSGQYTWVVDVGAVTEYTLQTWTGTYYAAATAYNSEGESGYSNEESFS